MFTGLVAAIGTLRRRTRGALGARVHVEVVASAGELGPHAPARGGRKPGPLGVLELGESIAVDGVCLTVDRIDRDGFVADLSAETLTTTTLGALPLGARLHLERAVPLGGRMGGHSVLGHVDGIGRVVSSSRLGDARRLVVRVASGLRRFVAPKGSVALNGVSLTVNDVVDLSDGAAGGATEFDVMLVPHTLAATNLGSLRRDASLNVEIDVLARYVARQLQTGSVAAPGPDRSDHAEESRSDERILAKLRAGGFT